MFKDELNKLTQTEFETVLKFGVHSSKIMGFDCESLIYSSFGFVKEDCPDLIKSEKYTEMFQVLLKERGHEVSIEEIEESDYNQLLSNLIWVIRELKQLGELEENELSLPPDADLVNAGVNELNKLGVFNIIDSLAGGDILKHDEVRALPYYKVFDKLLKGAIESKIQKNYAKIQQNKVKNKR